ncbi:PilX N-terminal domain-containing pilus assembly protein [Pseudoxanthomonas sp. z9]|uniref:pilus assembly PilX family protein n=1 Tax=Pseudoxanthomonas sp. z9 TaxID=2584942 RepID=UPI00114494BF|nr:PilX N-terminal domain-containing pilus assembly protein [Pseudoxanthomonas sp. z9]MCL6713999.1 PilX N-terminal domain-containing pilus assembly protein [Pseudomonas sp. R2.Fl]
MKPLHPCRSAHGQRGVSLLIVLILLLIMTLLGLAAMRGTLLEERMTANMLDRSLAFQAAEAALREGETIAGAAATRAAVPSAGCSNGICSLPDASQTDRWLTEGFNGWRDGATDVGELGVTPEFFIEYMGDAPTWPGCDLVDESNRSPLCLRPRYRITARSEAADRATVLLQTNFIAQ